MPELGLNKINISFNDFDELTAYRASRSIVRFLVIGLLLIMFAGNFSVFFNFFNLKKKITRNCGTSIAR